MVTAISVEAERFPAAPCSGHRRLHVREPAHRIEGRSKQAMRAVIVTASPRREQAVGRCSQVARSVGGIANDTERG
jgi:hypothetical protein